MRKTLMAFAIVGCLIVALVGFLLPFMQGWIFLVLALYLLASEFESGRRWVRRTRVRWPFLSTWIAKARGHPWAPRQLRVFDDLTKPD
jgi:uncharacterized membrane protein YbaN (DUF454 family)